MLVLVFILAALTGAAGTALIVAPSERAHATHCGLSSQVLRYSYQNSTLAAYGVDGFVEYAPGILSDPACNKIANSLSVTTADRANWIQVGMRIGYLSTNDTYDSSYQVYLERVDNGCLPYHRSSWGAPSATNSAYYLSYTGNYTDAFMGSCFLRYYLFDIRRDDWYNAPFATTYLRVSSPKWIAQSEIGSLKGSPPWSWTGTVKFGNPSGTLAYGMAWFDYPGGQTWNEWTSGTGASTGAQSPLCYTSNVAYRAYTATKAC
jgi:hypothetical protein